MTQNTFQIDYRVLRLIAKRWLSTVEHQFNNHGQLMEKYNVVAQEQIATGGEYEVQHGFGWTNGVTSAFTSLLSK